MIDVSIEQAMQIAVGHHHDGRLAEAERLCRQVLTQIPNHPEALHLLGLIAGQSGHLEAAIELIRRAIELRPDLAQAHADLGAVLTNQGRRDEAIAAYQRVIELRPDNCEAHTKLGIALYAAGRTGEAVAALERAVVVEPGSAEAHNNLGIALRKAERREAALAAYHQAIALWPDYPVAHNNLGNVLREMGRLGDAIAALDRAVALDPGSAEAHSNRGVALHEAGRFDDAIAALGRAIELRPEHAPAYNNLGITLAAAHRLEEALAAHRRAVALRPDSAENYDNLGRTLRLHGQLEAAIAAHRRAIQIDPDDFETHNHLGVALHEAGRTDEAIAACRRAIELKPDSADAHGNLGNVLSEAGRLDEAMAALERAIQLKPTSAEAHNNLGVAYHRAGQSNEALACFRRAVEHKPDYAPAASNILFTAHFHGEHDALMLLAEHRRWAAQFATPLAAPVRPFSNDRTPDRKLRIGFVSPDFRSHPVGRLLRPLFAHRNHQHAEFFAYSDVRTDDSVTHDLQAHSDGWLSIVGMSDVLVADRIRNDRIDILVDLALHTASNRMLVFARKPAPVQATMLGLPTTTGLDTIDYRLTDPYLDPPGATEHHYTEKSIRIPHCFWCYQPAHDSPAVGQSPALRNGFVTFGCLNQFAKVNRPALQLWAEILRSLPGSRLVLQSPSGIRYDPVLALFRDAGIALDRIEFATMAPFRQYLERYHELDLCLDPFPYNGGTTTMDALWMGVPVITLAGRTAVGRGGVSILTNLGLTELIARSSEEYVDIAVSWGSAPVRLSELRAGLRQRMQASPLLDGKQYAANVELALRQMWKVWCSS